jgi:hypothetical protein
MIRPLALAGLLLSALPARAAPPEALVASFRVGPLDSRTRPGEVQLRLSYRRPGENSNDAAPIPVRELEGFDPRALDAAKAPVHFVIDREAGDLACDGDVRGGEAVGDCRFTPDPAFLEALARHRIDRPSLRQQYQMALYRVGIGLVEALERQHYETPSPDDLVAAGIFKIDPGFIQGLAAVGCPVRRMGQAVEFRIHGLDLDYVRGLAAIDPRLVRGPPRDLVGMKIQGVTVAWVKALNEAGFKNFTAADLTRLRIHGVDPDWAKRLAEHGYRDVTADQLAAMRINGVR